MTTSPSTSIYGDLTTQGASSNIAWHHTSVDRAATKSAKGPGDGLSFMTWSHSG